MPEITVAITTYNLKRHLKQCFDDLSAQSFQDFEILVYDDCSTDGTREQLAVYQEQFGSKMQVIMGTTPQRMPSKARNTLLRSGKIGGKYVIFLDGDDRVEPSFLERLYTAAQAKQADIVICAYDRFEDESGHVLCQEMQGWPEEILLGENSTRSPAFINTALWNKLIRTERISDLRMPEFPVGEDATFLLSLYMRCKKIVCIDEILIHYRVRAASVISNTSEESIYDFAEELYRLWCEAENLWMKDTLAFAAFIHIGLSMPMRAYDNPDVDTGKILAWIRTYFAENYGWLRRNRYLHLPYLLHQGVKGLGIYMALWCHRFHCFQIFLWMYKAMVRFLRIEIKF